MKAEHLEKTIHDELQSTEDNSKELLKKKLENSRTEKRRSLHSA